jgi:hypothetical protein
MINDSILYHGFAPFRVSIYRYTKKYLGEY